VAIFGKSDNVPGPSPAPEKPSAPPFTGGTGTTVIGPKARFVGEVSGDEDILVQGQLEGNVKVQRRVTVAPAGEIKGDVHARSVIVGGRVQGEIRADEKAELQASASVQGNVSAPKVVIAEGAQLQGNVAMSSTPGAASAAPAKQKAEEM
jgi:cytoskeletal protein CcmA (bactofilin family)